MRSLPPIPVYLLVVLGTGGMLCAEEDDYAAPDFSKKLFAVESTLLTRENRGELADLLAGLAFHPSYIEVPTPLREKAIALALNIDPVHREARRAHKDLLDEKGPTPFEEGSAMTVSEIAAALVKAAQELGSGDLSKDEAILRAYLLAVAMEADPEGIENGRALFREAVRAAGISGWKEAVTIREGEENLFPSLDEPAPSPGNPAPGEDGGIAAEIRALGFALAESNAHALSIRRSGKRGDRSSVTKFSPLHATVELRDALDRGPQLRLGEVVFGANGRGFRPQSVMALVRARHPTWPARADVVVDFENRDFGLPGRLAELPVALAVDALMSGDEPASNVIAMGALERDGTLGPSANYADVLSSIPSAADAFFLVIPKDAERDLVDFALEGKLDFLVEKQVFLAGSLKEAALLASADPGKNLQRARLEFGQVQDALEDGVDVEALKSESVQSRLQNVIALAPGHASADILLRVADQNLPERLSFRGSLRVMGEILRPWKRVGEHVSAPLGRVIEAAESESLRDSNTATAQRLAAFEGKLSPQLEDVHDAASGLVSVADDFLTLQERGSSRTMQVRAELLKNWQELLAEFDRLAKTAAATTPRPGLAR